MIAKVIAHGVDREDARERLAEMLDDTAIWPVRTNATFLIQALAHPEFVSGEVDTGLIGRDGEAMAAAPEPAVGALVQAARDLIPAYDQPGFRVNAPAATAMHILVDGEPVAVELDGPGDESPVDVVLIAEQGAVWEVSAWRKDASHGAAAGSGAILSPMPGKVIAVEVAAGDRVIAGQKLLTLEAMKMEHTLTAPFDGVVAELNTVAGAQVQVDALLVRIEAEGEE